ncbi:MAG: ribosomal protection-like ABC-F family protein [Christensenellales bacterium]|jgi:ATP-binding cassette subfamily F protein 3
MLAMQAQKIEKHYGADPILRGASLQIGQGERIGIVGPNGAGKTTLLRILCGKEPADAGQVIVPGGLKAGYLPQVTAHLCEGTVWEHGLLALSELFEMEKAMRALEKDMGRYEESSAEYRRIQQQYTRIGHDYEMRGGFAWKSRLTGTLTGLGFSCEQFDRQVSRLSGGEQARLALAKLLVEAPDILLLDEPTNHLDLEAVQWLQDYLKQSGSAIVIVSHDRYFLDALCSGIVELENGTTVTYKGNYTQYQSLRETRRELEMRQYENYRREVARQEEIVQRLKSYNREKTVRRARSREKVLEKMQEVERPRDAAALRFSFSAQRPSGQDVLMAQDLSKAYGGDPLFEHVDLLVKSGERIAIIGPNGCGKSTLLNILRRQLMPDTGYVRFGSGVSVGYFDQQQAELLSSSTVLEEIHGAYPRMTHGEVRNALAAFLFRGDDVFQDIATLSGGEKARLALLKVMLRRDNTLLLDEPTNHLDADARSALETALDGFDGTIIAVSHDRYFINRFAKRILAFTKEGVLDIAGNYDDYLRQMQNPQRDEAQEPCAATKTALRKKMKQQRASRAQLRALRARIAEAERAVSALEGEMSAIEEKLADSSALSQEELTELSRRYQALEETLAAAMQDWEHLSQKEHQEVGQT